MKFKILEKIKENEEGIPTQTFFSQETKGHREQKLVSNDCYVIFYIYVIRYIKIFKY